MKRKKLSVSRRAALAAKKRKASKATFLKTSKRRKRHFSSSCSSCESCGDIPSRLFRPEFVDQLAKPKTKQEPLNSKGRDLNTNEGSKRFGISGEIERTKIKEKAREAAPSKAK